jgi:hypothetical protein
MPNGVDTKAQAARESIAAFRCFCDAARLGGAVEGVVFGLLLFWADVAHIFVVCSRKDRQ